MRAALVLGTLALSLAPGSPVQAQSNPDIRFVLTTEAEVRSGPSTNPQYYVTNRLRRGDPVEVVETLRDGWLKIRPPVGSFSWINTRFLEHIKPNLANAVVTAKDTPVPVYVGSVTHQGRPTVIGCYLKLGAQVTSIGKALADSDGTWMPIDATQLTEESRYIREEAVGRSAVPGAAPRPAVGAQTTAGTPHPADRSGFVGGPLPPGQLQPSSAPQARPGTSNAELNWARAQQADRAGQIPEAVRLYALVAAETVSTNPTLSTAALSRAQYLQNAHRNYGAVAAAPVQTRYVPPPPAPSPVPQGRVYPVAAETAAGSPIRALPTSTGGAYPQASPAAGASVGGSSGYPTYTGRLVFAGRCVDGHRTYRLEVNNAPVLYVTPQTGLDLEPFIYHTVEVTGPALYRGDLRANYMTAVHIRALQ